ncbi:phosphohistidine phosphatase [Nocardiopsis sp. Huas11]|uniref:SixA phosphatase family protein n=1 Tax=Nocardiopsis sp. Huas11 TaxID=2183912 RepID=UPI000EB5CABB|nr:histidine phosphatase family protein [Nocardiopsis sp. Huas11]RKS06411.1 phosphohistidine phosphatase [Nocardiopsis sp. Huas11]
MKRTLLLMRHAKADVGHGEEDFDRPLNDRGHLQAASVGRLLAEGGYVPDHVICSGARRTRQTLRGVLHELHLETAPEVDYTDEAYSAGPDDLLGMINRVDPEAGTVLVVGHNPTIAQLAAGFLGDDTLTRYAPATVAAIELEVDWLYAAPGTGTGKILG